MKKVSFIVYFCIILSLNLLNEKAYGEIVGSANYKKIEQNYKYAIESYKQVDQKILELQQFLLLKEKEYKNIQTPVARKNFEDRIQREYKAKEDAALKFKLSKEDEVYKKIIAATKAVAKEKQIELVLDYRMIFTGSVDLTDEIISYLNQSKK